MFYVETPTGKVRRTFERLARASDDIAFIDVGPTRSKFAVWFAAAAGTMDRAILSEVRLPGVHVLPSLRLAVKSMNETRPTYLLCVSAQLSPPIRRDILKFGMANDAILLLPNVSGDLGSLHSECLSHGYCVESMDGDRPFAATEDRYVCVGSWARHRDQFVAAFIWNEDDNPVEARVHAMPAQP